MSALGRPSLRADCRLTTPLRTNRALMTPCGQGFEIALNIAGRYWPRVSSALSPASRPLVDAYVDLLARAVSNYLYLGGAHAFDEFRAVEHYDLEEARWTIDRQSCPFSLLTNLQL